MEILLAIFIIIALFAVLAVGGFVCYALARSVFAGPGSVEKGILAALLAIFLFD